MTTSSSRFIKSPGGRLVPVPESIPATEVVEVEEVEEVAESPGAVDEVSDIVNVSVEDVLGRDSDNIPAELDEDDMEDLFGVSQEDIMGSRPEPEKPKLRRVIRRVPPSPPTTLGGIR